MPNITIIIEGKNEWDTLVIFFMIAFEKVLTSKP